MFFSQFKIQNQTTAYMLEKWSNELGAYENRQYL